MQQGCYKTGMLHVLGWESFGIWDMSTLSVDIKKTKDMNR